MNRCGSDEPKLHDLLASLFSKGEMERFAQDRYGEAFRKEVDFSGSDADVAFKLANALSRRGLVNDELFSYLVSSRLEKRTAIRCVQRTLPASASKKPPLNDEMLERVQKAVQAHFADGNALNLFLHSFMKLGFPELLEKDAWPSALADVLEHLNLTGRARDLIESLAQHYKSQDVWSTLLKALGSDAEDQPDARIEQLIRNLSTWISDLARVAGIELGSVRLMREGETIRGTLSRVPTDTLEVSLEIDIDLASGGSIRILADDGKLDGAVDSIRFENLDDDDLTSNVKEAYGGPLQTFFENNRHL